MNIEGVNLLSSSSVNGPVQGGQSALTENGATTESFSNTLTGQVDLLKKSSSETTSLEQANNITPSKSDNAAKNVGGSLQSRSGGDDSVNTLFEKQSVSYKQNTSVVIDKNADLQSTLQALTDGLKSTTANLSTDAKTIKNISPTLTDQLKSAASSIMSDVGATNAQGPTSTQPDKATAASTLKDTLKPNSAETIPDTTALAQNMSTAMAANAQAPTSTQADKATAASTLKDTLKPDSAETIPDTTALAQNMSTAMAANAQALTNTQPDKATTPTDPQNKGSSMPTSDSSVVTSSIFKKETDANQPTQNEQASNSPSFDDMLSSEKALAVKDLLTTSDAGQAATGVSADMKGVQQATITNKVDSPVLNKPLTHPDWSKDLGNQIIWMNNKELSTAEIKMNPEHLGPISVRIDLTDDQASVQFTAQHAAVKEALEASIPKLREMLGTQQLNLTNVTISQNSTSDQGQSQSPYQSFSRTPEDREQGINGVEETTSSRVVVNKGLLNVYA